MICDFFMLCMLSDDGVRTVVLVFHHVIKENSRIGISTHRRLSEKYQQCFRMLDAVLWEKNIYSCGTNDAMIDDLKEIVNTHRDLVKLGKG